MKSREKKGVFRRDLNSRWLVSDLTERGSSFQMDGAAHVKDLSPYFASRKGGDTMVREFSDLRSRMGLYNSTKSDR